MNIITSVKERVGLASVMIIGAAGRMGSTTVREAEARGISVIPIDPAVPNYPKLAEVTERVCAIIDFSLPSATAETVEYAVKRNIPAVIATTGHSEREYSNILTAAQSVPIFRAVNLSRGMQIIKSSVSLAAHMFPNADFSITETHGRTKRDTPSGTAKMLSDTVRTARGEGASVSSVRCGVIPGIHEVRICTEYGRITLTHEVFDRAEYAEGALKAAEFLIGNPPGLYGMNDLLSKTGGSV